jgi:hypothetical protein
MKKIVIAIMAMMMVGAACTDHGKKHTVGQLDVFVKEGISAEQVKLANAAFEAVGYDKQSASAQLVKEGEIFLVRFVVGDPKKIEEPAVVEAYTGMKKVFEEKVFPNAKVRLDFCDKSFVTLKSI